MFESLGNALATARQQAAAAAVKAFIAAKLGKFGDVTELTINPAERRIRLEVSLKGEPAAITVEVNGYDLENREGQTFLKVRQVRASREWITAALEEYVVDKYWRLPAAAALAL